MFKENEQKNRWLSLRGTYLTGMKYALLFYKKYENEKFLEYAEWFGAESKKCLEELSKLK